MDSMNKPFNIIVIILVVILAGTIVFFEMKGQKSEQKITQQMPILNTDPNYFADSEIWGGTMPDDKWTSAIIREGSRTQPTTEISLEESDYNQEVIELSPIKTDKEIYIMEDNMGAEIFTEQINEFGDLARRFLPDDVIGPVEKFDVDKDGKDEQIISTCGLWGNGCPHQIVIVKDNKIIFRTGGRDIVKTDNGNGFTLIWQKEYKDPYGEMRTRFVFEDGKFKPIYEQEVKYFRAEIIE
jgi:hypothetical protein